VKKQRAFTLMELMVAISACTVILTTSAVLLQRVIFVHAESQEFFEIERTIIRLTDQFRHDVRQATVADIDASGPNAELFLRLKLPDGQLVEYQHRGDTVVRRQTSADGTTWREEFAFAQSVELALQQFDSPPRLVLTVVAVPDVDNLDEYITRFDERAHTVLLQVVAALGAPGQIAIESGQE